MLKGGHSRKKVYIIYIVNAEVSKVQVFPHEIHLHRNPKFNIVAGILNSTQQPGCIFMLSFLRDFIQMASGSEKYSAFEMQRLTIKKMQPFECIQGLPPNKNYDI